MSPKRLPRTSSPALEAELHRLWLALGVQVRDARRARRWSAAELAQRAGVSRWLVYVLERGRPVSIDVALRLARALGRGIALALIEPRRGDQRQARQADVVHAAMGELEAGHLRRLGFAIGLDEPYQHFQFAGRADLVAWDLSKRMLLHIENRTRFPDFQDMAGSYNAKRSYLGDALARRLGIRGWASETHVLAALWSAEVLHAIRMHPQSLTAICPDPADAFTAWWSGGPPLAGKSSTLVVLDPAASGRQRLFAGRDDALSSTTRARYRGYAEAATALAEHAAA